MTKTHINMRRKTMTDCNLECYVEVTNAPGPIAAVFLPYDTFGTKSNVVNGATVDSIDTHRAGDKLQSYRRDIGTNLEQPRNQKYPAFAEFPNLSM